MAHRQSMKPKKRQSCLYTDSKQSQKSKHQTKNTKRRYKIMILNMYAIKDELNGFTPPIPFMSEELAKRYLKDQVISNPTVGNTPKDFSMWHVGLYDSETAEFTQTTNRLIERAENYANN